ncbi:hypothetical protein B0T14DRAFT_501310 [Immersiella caudata]|uniref:Nephrocystin 3-like N-terminal domain-containing protein n=1 Tax=Immersiella caudata TaxID=314043 RepID=A0AA39XC59_9PEZI|nr:hypothetical protein B0T14DRAFT_501310 [Immersiella caudata]
MDDRNRTLHSQSLAIDFIDRRLLEYHPYFDKPPTTFDSTSGMYVPKASAPELATERPLPSAPDRMRFWAALFPKAMESFKKQCPAEPKGRLQSGQSIRGLSNWEEVHDRLRANRQDYDNPQGRVGALRRGMRSVMDKSQPLRGMVNFIPNNDYLAPVAGTLGIILDAAKKATNLRQEVAAALDNLERNFEDVETFLVTYPNDQNIINGSVNLLASILKAIEYVIGYYMRNTMSKAVAALIMQDDFQASLTASLEEITSSGQLLLKEAEKSNFWQNRNTLGMAKESSAKLDRVVESQQKIADTQNEMKVLLEQMQMNMEKYRQQNIYLTAEVIWHRERTPSPTRVVPSVPPISQEDLTASLLGDIDGVLESDTTVEQVVQCREMLPRADREIAERVVTTSKFREWLAAPVSRELLIHGNFTGTQYTSALSLFCATLIRTLQEEGGPQGRYLALVFFCGKHLDDASGISGGDTKTTASVGGLGMIRSLVAQLLTQRPFNLNEILPRVNIQAIRSGDIHQLLSLFTELVQQVSRSGTSIFCLLDGLKYYEREEYLDDMSLVLRHLLDVREGGTHGSVFKVLITSPSPTTIVRQAFSEDGILSLALVRSSGQGFSADRMRRQLS